MAQVLFRNALGSEAAPAIALPRRRVRLSTVMRRHVPEGFRPDQRPVLVSVHRANDPIAVRNETVRLRKEWSITTVGVRDVVVITLLPQGGGGGNQLKTIGAALASVALTALAGPIGTAVSGALFAGSALAAQIISAGVMVGGSFLLSLAARPKANKEDQTGPYGVTGGGVLPRPGERIPSVYGRTWVEPDLSQPDYMIYEGNEQVLFKRMTIGLGKYTIHTIRTGDSVMWTAAGGVQAAFQGLEIDIINPGETTTLVPSNVLSSSQVNGNELQRPGDNPEWTGPFVLGAPDQTYTKIQIDWSAPRGVYWRDGNGRIRTAYVKCKWEYAPVDADGNPTAAWQTLLAFNDGYASDKPIRRSHIITVPNGRYAVRAKNEREEANDTWTDSVNWDGLRAPMDDNTVRPRVTEIAMKIKAGPELGITSFADILVDVSRILPVWNGSAWVEQATRKAVWAWVDILRNTDYGAALSTNVIDVAKALSYATAITEFDTFDGVIRGPVSVWEAASTVLFPLRAEPTFLGSIWSFTRDEPTAIRRTLFTRRQIVRGTTRQEWGLSTQDGAADVIVSYNAAGDPKRPRESRHTIGAQSLTPRRIELPGVTDNRHAKHIAIWLSAIAAYRRKNISFETELDGRILTRGTPFGAEVWFEGSQAVGVQSYSGTGNRTLTLTADVTLASGDFIMLRDKRGRAWGPVQATVSSPRVIVLDATDVTNVVAATGQSLTDVLESDGDMPSLMIRTGSTVAQDWLCQSVEPSGRDRVAIRGVLASNDVWTALGVTIPSIPNLPGPPTIPTQPALIWIRADARQHTTSLEVAWSTSVVPGIRQVQVQISYDGTEYADIYKGTAFEGTAPLRMSSDPVTVRARGFGARNVPSAWVSTSFTTGTATIPGPSIPPGIIDIDKLDPIIGGLLNGNNPGSLPWAQAQINAGNKRLDEIGKDLDSVVKASDRQFSFDIEVLAQSLAALQSRFEQLSTGLVEATFEINSAEGRARIGAVAVMASDTARQFNSVALELSSLDARISAIASVVIDGDLDGLIDQITTVALELDALAASLTLYATKAELDQQVLRINQAELDIDANAAAITLKAAQTVVDALTTRVNQAELTISAQAGIIQQVVAQTGVSDIDLTAKTLAEILDLLSKNQNFQVEKVGRATSGLNARITEQGDVIATQRTELLALNNETRAIVVQESTARASADAALATSITALQATVNDPTTGLPATFAQLADERTTRATRDAAIAEAFLGLRSTLSRRSAVTINNTAPASPAENDLWVRPDLSHQVFRRVGGSWVFVTGGASYTFTRSNAMPVTPNALHIWADQDDADRLYEWNGNIFSDLTTPVVVATASFVETLSASVTQQGNDISALSSRVTGVEATIPGLATAQSVSTLSSQVQNINGQVTALSQSLTAVDAKVDNSTASGRFRVVSVATAAGAVSSVEARVDATSGAQTVRGAFRLDAINVGNERHSRMVVNTDLFAFATGTTATQVFTASASGVWIDAPLWVGGTSNTILIDGGANGPRIIGYGP